MSVALTALLLATLAGLLFQLAALYHITGLSELATRSDPEPPAWPSITLVLPACNEEATIEAALQSVLALDYPALQILAIDDRSTDRTGDLLDALAAEHPALEVLHIRDLPPGWLGKLHAMHVGAQAATGDFVIYADADVHFVPGVLRRAVAWAEHERLDMLALVPRMTTSSIALGAAIGNFAGAWMFSVRARSVNRDTPGAYAGVGAFNMVRRSVFERTEGWPWLRLEIADDIGIAMLMHRHGARGRIAVAAEHLSLSWYGSLGEMIQGLEKNMFAAIGRFRVSRAVAVALVCAILPFCPLAILFTPLWAIGAATLVLQIAGAFLVPAAGVSRAALLLSPFAQTILAAALLRSTYKTVRRGTLVWRGTAYDIDELRANQRVLI